MVLLLFQLDPILMQPNVIITGTFCHFCSTLGSKREKISYLLVETKSMIKLFASFPVFDEGKCIVFHW
jgi:hypothetical protein